MGLESQWILSDERHSGPFECAICQTLPEPSDALTTCLCSHVFCRACLVQWLTNRPVKTCPTCNQDLSYSNTSSSAFRGGVLGSMQVGDTTVTVLPLHQAQPLAHRLLGSVLVKCPLSKHVGCKWQGDYADLQSHLVSSTTHNISTPSPVKPSTTAAKKTTEGGSTSDDVQLMEVELDLTSSSSSSPSVENSAREDRLQLALKTAAGMKDEANGKFETRRYDDALSLYTKGITILEERMYKNETNVNVENRVGEAERQLSSSAAPTALENECYKLLSQLYSNRAASHLSLGNNQECIDDCRYVITELSQKGVETDSQIIDNSKIYVRACRAAVELGDLNQASYFAEQGLCALDTAAAATTTTTTSGGRAILLKELDKVHAMQHVASEAQDALLNHRYADAKSCYSQLLMRAQSALPFLLGAAQSDLGLGLTDAALRLTKRILLKYPKSSNACWCRGQALFLMGESETGLKLIQEGLRLDPDAVEIRTSYKSLKKVKEWMDQAKQQMFRRQFRDVIQLLTQCVDQCTSSSFLPPKSPLFATLHTDRAEAYLRLKEYSNVLRDCAKVVYAQEGHIPAWLIRIQAYHGLEDHETAMEEIQQLLQRFEQDGRLQQAYEKADFLIRKKNRVDYYDLFGVASIASVMEIKKAYKIKSMQFHPDRIPPSASDSEKKEAQRKFQLLGEGLEILCDDFQRKLYDEGYDPAAIRERVQAANHAAHHHQNGRYPHGHGGGHNHH